MTYHLQCNKILLLTWHTTFNATRSFYWHDKPPSVQQDLHDTPPSMQQDPLTYMTHHLQCNKTLLPTWHTTFSATRPCLNLHDMLRLVPSRPSHLHDVFIDVLEVLLLEHLRLEPRGRSGRRRGLAHAVLRWWPAIRLKSSTDSSQWELRHRHLLSLSLSLSLCVLARSTKSDKDHDHKDRCAISHGRVRTGEVVPFLNFIAKTGGVGFCSILWHKNINSKNQREEREGARQRERDRDRVTETERDRDRETEKAREREAWAKRERESVTEREREWQREREGGRRVCV